MLTLQQLRRPLERLAEAQPFASATAVKASIASCLVLMLNWTLRPVGGDAAASAAALSGFASAFTGSRHLKPAASAASFTTDGFGLSLAGLPLA